jgi:hypothetical protein
MRAPHTIKPRPHTTPPVPAGTRRRGRLRHAAAELTPHTIEQIAQRVAQLLRERGETGPQPTRLLDAAQLAIHLGVTRTWVYEHAQQLGAIRLGAGTKARLRFDLATATTAIKSLHEHPTGNANNGETLRRGRSRRRQQATFPLLPIYEPRARGILDRITRTGRRR